MQPLALRSSVHGPSFDSQGLANIGPHHRVPYVDISATKDASSRHMTVALLNRHPVREARLSVTIDGRGSWSATGARMLSARHPLEANTLETPGLVGVRNIDAPAVQRSRFTCRLPASSVMVVTLYSN
jgi:alpha-L-arabinofuranosidase